MCAERMLCAQYGCVCASLFLDINRGIGDQGTETPPHQSLGNFIKNKNVKLLSLPCHAEERGHTEVEDSFGVCTPE